METATKYLRKVYYSQKIQQKTLQYAVKQVISCIASKLHHLQAWE